MDPREVVKFSNVDPSDYFLNQKVYESECRIWRNQLSLEKIASLIRDLAELKGPNVTYIDLYHIFITGFCRDTYNQEIPINLFIKRNGSHTHTMDAKGCIFTDAIRSFRQQLLKPLVGHLSHSHPQGNNIVIGRCQWNSTKLLSDELRLITGSLISEHVVSPKKIDLRIDKALCDNLIGLLREKNQEKEAYKKITTLLDISRYACQPENELQVTIKPINSDELNGLDHTDTQNDESAQVKEVNSDAGIESKDPDKSSGVKRRHIDLTFFGGSNASCTEQSTDNNITKIEIVEEKNKRLKFIIEELENILTSFETENRTLETAKILEDLKNHANINPGDRSNRP